MGKRGPGGGLFLEGGADSCLLLPDFPNTGWTERLAEELNQAGFTVSAPDLAFFHETSNGPSPSNWRSWLDEVREAYARLDRTMRSVAVAGAGIGGALSLILAAEYPVSAVVAMDPALRMPGLMGMFRPASVREGLTGSGMIRMRDVRAVVRLARRSLFAVVAPILAVEALPGGFLHPTSANLVFSGVSSREKQVLWLPRSHPESLSEAELEQSLDAIKNHLRRATDQKRL